MSKKLLISNTRENIGTDVPIDVKYIKYTGYPVEVSGDWINTDYPSYVTEVIGDTWQNPYKPSTILSVGALQDDGTYRLGIRVYHYPGVLDKYTDTYTYGLPQPLCAINGARDRLYWDEKLHKYCIEKKVNIPQGYAQVIDNSLILSTPQIIETSITEKIPITTLSYMRIQTDAKGTPAYRVTVELAQHCTSTTESVAITEGYIVVSNGSLSSSSTLYARTDFITISGAYSFSIKITGKAKIYTVCTYTNSGTKVRTVSNISSQSYNININEGEYYIAVDFKKDSTDVNISSLSVTSTIVT